MQAVLNRSQKRHTSFEIGSIIPSLAKSRFNQYNVLEALTRDFATSLSQNVSQSLFEPKYLKIFLERLIALNFHDYEGATLSLDFSKTESGGKPFEIKANALFFKQMLQLINTKRIEL
jgi:hypothetical protein